VTDVVLDASALLAVLNDERGAARVEPLLAGARISSVNLAEVAGKLVDVGLSDDDVRTALDSHGFTVVPFDERVAMEAGLLRRTTRDAGLSLGDRACLATARVLDLTVVTVDKAWRGLKVGVEIDVVR
jgi:ribonuclease VapC